MQTTKYLLVLLAALVIGCGDSSTGPGDADGGGGTPGMDGSTGGGDDGGTQPGTDGGGTGTTDGGANGACGTTECSNCIDDDGDGTIDGFDVECISAADDDEGSFATGIPGDNIDERKQDCFFDGNSGAGDDGCDIPVCCLLGDCPAGTDCSVTQQCIDFCAPAAPPGCDCFGCCTICNDTQCRDVLLNPAVAPNCDADTLGDETACPACTKVGECETGCDNTNCVLCPGQTEDDLPDECNMQQECPNGQDTCTGTGDCATGYYCSNGCCLENIIIQ